MPTSCAWGVEPLSYQPYALRISSLRLLLLLGGSGTGAGYGLLLYFLLELEDAVEDGFRVGRAAGDIDVDGHYFIYALHDGVGGEGAARGGAVAHRDAPLGLGHLVPDGAHDRGKLLGDRAAHQHHVTLARGEAVEHAEAF